MSYNDDMTPPRVFSTVTSASVSGQADFFSYLVGQEEQRRVTANLPPMTPMERTEFTRDLVRKLAIQQDTMGAINHRSQPPKKILLEQE
jgi:hypothetical protein